jgi:hypothetical protein
MNCRGQNQAMQALARKFKALAAILLSSPAIAARQGDPVKMFDTDNDGLISGLHVLKLWGTSYRGQQRHIQLDGGAG